MTRPITRVARVRIDPSMRFELLEAYRAYAEAILEDDDLLAWEICTEADDENLVWIIATFPDAEAHARHMAHPATAEVMPVIQSAVVEPPTMTELISHHSTRPG